MVLAAVTAAAVSAAGIAFNKHEFYTKNYYGLDSEKIEIQRGNEETQHIKKRRKTIVVFENNVQHGKSERKNELHMCMLFGSVRVPLGLDVFLVVRQSVCGCLV